MSRKQMTAIRSYNIKDLQKKIRESRSELAKLRAVGAKGTLKKDSGRLRPLRRNIARMETRIGEILYDEQIKKITEEVNEDRRQ